MAEFTKDSNLISRSEFALTEIRRILDQLHVLYNDLELWSQQYTGPGQPPPEVEVRLRASVLLFESYFFRQISVSQQPVQRSIAPVPTTLRLFLHGKWLTHEMGQVLFSANPIIQLFSVWIKGTVLFICTLALIKAFKD